MGQVSADSDVEPATQSRRQHIVDRLQVPAGQLALAALGLYFALEARSLGLWTELGPGPGLLPLVLGVALLGLTAAWAVQTVVQQRRDAGERGDDGSPGERLDATYVLGILGGLIVLASVIDLLGFQISMALFLLIELLWLGRQRWWLAATIALVASIGTFVLFDRVLHVPLPLSSIPALSGLGL